jgi:hypothetical protein
MTSFFFWQRWLLVVSVAITAFGILMTLLSGTSLFELFNRQIDPAFWGTKPVEAGARVFQRWIYGVWGATIAGWGVFLAFIAHYSFRRKENWAWRCMIIGLLVWFVLDTFLSLCYGVYFNAAFNTVLLILVALPIVFTRRHFA